MSYLHCHNCGWSQDDFWSEEGWNPFESIISWKKQLFQKDIDKAFTTDHNFHMQNGNISLREVIARIFEKEAQNIRNMIYRNREEFKEKNPERKCPICKQKSLDED